MGGMLSDRRDKEGAERRPGPRAIYVNGIRYANSAAKFWISLIDEVREDFPRCSLIRLTAALSGDLQREHLFPETSLQRALLDWRPGDFERVMQETIAEIDLLGPPAGVRAQLLAGDETILSRDLPAECVDAELFPYLIVWPLEWTRHPCATWNGDRLAGEFEAEDKARKIRYAIRFDLTRRHLSEGLFERSIAVAFAAGPWASEA